MAACEDARIDVEKFKAGILNTFGGAPARHFSGEISSSLPLLDRSLACALFRRIDPYKGVESAYINEQFCEGNQLRTRFLQSEPFLQGIQKTLWDQSARFQADVQQRKKGMSEKSDEQLDRGRWLHR